MVKPKKHSDKLNIKPGQNTSLSYLLQRNPSPLFKSRSLPSPRELLLSKKTQTNTDPASYIEVDMSDLPSQYAEEIETFDPRDSMPRSSTTIWGLDDEKG